MIEVGYTLLVVGVLSLAVSIVRFFYLRWLGARRRPTAAIRRRQARNVFNRRNGSEP